MRELSLLTDFYQLTMMQGHYLSGRADVPSVFEMFVRNNPAGGGFSVFAGLEQFVEYIENLRFNDSDITYLRGLDMFNEQFLEYLRDFKFTGDIYTLQEGSVFFPDEPVIVVKAGIAQANFIETALLNIINHQSLIATKAARVCYAAGSNVMEFGTRRAQGPDAAVFGARAAVVGGCIATSNALAAKRFDIPVRGTHSHSWIMSFDCELTAFRAYADAFADRCVLLVDTYDTLASGIPNAIKVFGELKATGKLQAYGIRLDSGDFAYLSKMARKMLDDAGFTDAYITITGDLDEYLIQELKLQGAKVDYWGVGTRLITSKDAPSMGGVYKLTALEQGGKMMPKIKLSENPEKVTTPSTKRLWRIYDKTTGMMKADYITLEHEGVDENTDLTLFDPKAPWKKMYLKVGDFTARQMLTPIFKNGKCVYKSPPISEIAAYCKAEQATLWEEYRRLVNPHIMPVDLSQELYDLKQQMIWDARHS
ncbi:MAG: nicotinate phosphoribosyltransferase [Defluviitaleaceae bacterium]|nr:nicotinate phosphoribosyltransferase [Defluviitaleaceae bacterium]